MSAREARFVTPEAQVITNKRFSIGGTLLKTPWTRRHTPYAKTPKSRRIAGPEKSAALDVSLSSAERRDDLAQEEETLSGLVNKTWRVYQMTPLYNFKYGKLKEYSRSLSKYLQAQIQKGIELDPNAEVSSDVKITEVKGLNMAEEDNVALKVTVRSKQKAANGEKKVLLTMLLCCTDALRECKPTCPDSFTILPLMLSNGNMTMGNHINNWFKTSFDCSVQKMVFNSIELAWMVSMWASLVPERSAKSVELTYKVPDEVEGLDRITYTIDPHDCKAIWESVHDESKDMAEADEVSEFVLSLEKHFDVVFKTHLSSLFLTRVGTSVAYVSTEGKLKLFTKKHIHKVLRYLTELALEKIQAGTGT
ncbi:unnamed protein product [Owenia fusiformis]|uniref:Centromere protein L n=1 Tax=Owenia fusiformis TaxID=6347 RepID=A0A8J1URZ1_OWEFU|nr:unnamed protein product [Owenia fusiformis]CAH1780495.1 unnamed protein product [Owenia fusiformis]CAH1780496.1 unnamed protein product [Owenia fusiformis]